MNNIFKIEIDHKRIFGLDILRALAILFVIIQHGSSLLPDEIRYFYDLFVFDGVSIFFVLSGFLIGGILIKLINEKGIKLSVFKYFLIRRWFRTLPNYFLILITLSFLHFFFEEGFTFSSISSFFIFSQNIFKAHPSIFFPEAWSLSVEEWFYLIIPILIGLLTFTQNKSYKRGVFFTCILVIVLVTLFRSYRYFTVSIIDWDLIFRKQVVTRLDSLMFGVLGAYINYYYKSIWIKYKLKLFLIGILLFTISKFIIPKFVIENGIYQCIFSFTLISIATLLLLPYLSELKTGKGFLFKPITYLSLTSYSMYLINLSIIRRWILSNIPWTYFTDNNSVLVISQYVAYWILVISLSILIYKYFEIPITNLRDKIK